MMHSALAELNSNYIRSVRDRDTEWFQENLAPDFLNSNPDTTFVDKAKFIDQIHSGPGLKRLECEDVRIRILGDIALIHARTRFTNDSGQDGIGRYTDVWARREGRWICVSADVIRQLSTPASDHAE